MIIFLIITTSVSLSRAIDYQVDYYENLIKAEIERSSTYKLPKDASEYRPFNDVPKVFGTYDFVVIGAGSAGSVVASRLSEIEEWNVLLLEAGKEENDFSVIPAMWSYLRNLEFNWGFESTPQKCCQARNGSCLYPRGKSLGGSSAINGMVYTRGSRFDYDNWGSQGNDGWFYDDVLKFFIKLENSHINGSAGYHGIDGYVNVNYHEPINYRTTTFLNAHKELNIPVLDVNGPTQIGADHIPLMINNGKRQSTAQAFLTPARKRKNLKILTESYVTNIQISNFSRAENVIFSYKNVKYIVGVNKEVILSAGVIGSPQILMLSGVGPKEHLTVHGIPVVQDLAVGKNFHDHIGLSNVNFLVSKPETSMPLRDSIRQYLNGDGPLTGSSNFEAFSFLQFDNHTNLTDFETLFQYNLKIFDRPESVWEQPTSEGSVFNLVLLLSHTKSRGEISLKSSDPYDYPLIDFGCLTDNRDEDKENLYKIIDRVLNLLNTDAFKLLQPSHIPYPYCMNRGYLTRDYWTCVIDQTSNILLHSGGTCKMGPDPQEGAVVDNKLKIHGIQNVRVVDASIIPSPISAHTSAPCMMIGERAADFIKTEHAQN